jgi:hypothetical protein
MSEYTKGPWFIVEDSIMAPGEYLQKFVAKQVCGENAKEIRANSGLLSAAPELYEELKEISYSQPEDNDLRIPYVTIQIDRDQLKRIRAAIAKAEGHA